MVVLAGLVYGVYYWLVLSHYESTDNAYVQGNVVQITPQVGGTVIGIYADDTDFVKAGQRLVKLDPADAQVALEQAEAQLAQTVREVRTLYANNGTLRAQIAAARGRPGARAQRRCARRRTTSRAAQPLVRTGAVGKEEFNHVTAQLAAAKSAYAAAQSAVEAAREQLASNQTLTEDVSVEQHPNVLRAAARVREAYLALQPHRAASRRSTATSRGAACSSASASQAGAPLMSVVALSDVWVDANFKEGQLRNLRIGQPVELEADVYGKKVDVPRHGRGPRRGHRRGVRAAAGAERDRQLDQGRAARAGARSRSTRRKSREHPLRVGLSMDAKVDVSNTNGSVLAGTSDRPTREQTSVIDRGNEQADAEVQQDHRRQPRPARAPRPARPAPQRARRRRSRAPRPLSPRADGHGEHRRACAGARAGASARRRARDRAAARASSSSSARSRSRSRRS